MKLLVIVNVFAPDRGGAGAVYSDMCYGLAKRGIDVTVAAPYPYYPEWKDKSGRNGLSFWRYEDNGVKVVRFGLYIPKEARSLWQRMLFEVTLLLSLLRHIPQGRHYDATMVYCPNLGAVIAASMMKFLFGKPLWLNVQDIASDAAQSTGLVKSGMIGRSLTAIERFFYNSADIWSSISPVMIGKLESFRRRNQPILFLPNWVDSDLAGQMTAHPKLVRPAVRKPRLLYAGNIGGKQDLKKFCQALQRSEADFEFRIFGNGGAAGDLQAWLKLTGDSRFSFGPFLSAERLAEELAWSDFYVITEKPETGASFFPSKLIVGITSGTPILAVCDANGPLGSEIAAADLGPLFSWHELDRIPAVLESLTGDAERLNSWRNSASRRAGDFDRNAIIDRLEKNLESMVTAKKIDIRHSYGEVAGAAELNEQRID